MEPTNWLKVCAAVIPCFNEEDTVRDIIDRATPYVSTVLVVDDGSTDLTQLRATEAAARVIRHSTKRGKGMALRTGLEQARAEGFVWALTLDGDGQHAPEDIPKFFECADRTGVELVIGNRFTQSEQIPWVRRRVNRWMTARLAKLTRVPLEDSQCGFRLIRLEPFAQLKLETCHFETESELLVKFLGAGFQLRSVPVQVIYGKGKSKIRPVSDTWRWMRWWLAQQPNARR
ncbi:MAG: glycosyltransferase family 2 protein [Verrucomicrobia bacterium]|nr:glycosyltransferase family 2 protein [Verrucomicrobiota bacterium]